jgi:anti-sigma factor RsiW
MTGKPTPDLTDRLSAYLDGALSDTEAAEIAALAAGDQAVAEELAALRQADAAIAAAFAAMLETPVPAALALAIGTAPADAPVAANLPHRPRWGIGAAAAVALLMIGAGTGSVLTRALWAPPLRVAAAPDWLDQVAEYHRVYASQTRHLVEVPATDAGHLQTWLAATTGVRFKVPDLTGHGLTFQGARLLVAAGKPVGQLMYTNAKGEVVALCFVAGSEPSSGGAPTAFTDRNFGDIDMVVWTDRDASYVVVGPATGIALDDIARDAAVSL